MVTEQSRWVGHEADWVLFIFRSTRYILNNDKFEPLVSQPAMEITSIRWLSRGLTNASLERQRSALFGPCSIDVPSVPWYDLLLDELLHPFYVFQLFAIALWLWDAYYLYAFAIAIITFVSTTLNLVDTLASQKRLRELCRVDAQVRVLQYSENNPDFLAESVYESRIIDYKDIVPGHVIQLDVDMIVPCDAILLSRSVLANESMLTGETVPVLKTGLQFDQNDRFGINVYDIEKDKKSTLYAGTKIIAIKHDYGDESVPVPALVVKTGFSTLQGSMMRSILHPPKSRFTFYSDSFKFLGFLGCLAAIGAGVTIYLGHVHGLSAKETLIRCLDLFTVAVPPALPAAMTVGTSFAVRRLLAAWKVSCVMPTKINVAGQVNTMIFDKTGTLTDDKLEVQGMIGQEVLLDAEGEEISSTPCMQRSIQTQPRDLRASLVAAAACCSSLVAVDGKLLGDPEERLMFEFSDWIFEEKLKVPQRYIDEDRLLERWDPVTGRRKETVSVVGIDDAVTSVGPGRNITSTNSGVGSGSVAGSVSAAETRPTIAHGSGGSNFSKDRVSVRDVDRLLASNMSINVVRSLYGCDSVVPVVIRAPGSKGAIQSLLDAGVTLRELRNWQVCGPSVMERLQRGSKGFPAMRLQHNFLLSHDSNSEGLGSSFELGILRRFEFISSLRRMSVILKDPITQDVYALCKGAPEVVMERCRPDTLPTNALEAVDMYTRTGKRMYAFSAKWLGALSEGEVNALYRDDVEQGMQFLGLMVFVNPLKEDTPENIHELKRAGCVCIVATGDTSLTAVAVARDSGLASRGPMILADHVDINGSGRGKFTWTMVRDEISSTSCKDMHALRVNNHNSDVASNFEEKGSSSSVYKAEYSSLTELLSTVSDPRSVEIALTGKAFRELRSLHRRLCLPWADVGAQAQLRAAMARATGEPVRGSGVAAAAAVVSSARSITGNAQKLHMAAESGLDTPFAQGESWQDISSRTTLGELALSTLPGCSLCNGEQSSLVLLTSAMAGSSGLNSASEYSTLYMTAQNSNEGYFVISCPGCGNRPVCTKTENYGSTSSVSRAKRSSVGSCTSGGGGSIGSWSSSMNTRNSLSPAMMPLGVGSSFALTFDVSLNKNHDFADQRQHSHGNGGGGKGAGQTSEEYSDFFKPVTEGEAVLAKDLARQAPYRVSVSLYEFILRNATVYSRMSPDDKESLVNALRGLPSNPWVGMCGDGANDCSALKSADIGVSLSDAESSIAAPFTSATHSIRSCLDVLREGRAALCNSFQIFKFVALYSIIQFVAVTFLYSYGLNLTDSQFTWIDLIIALPMAILMSFTRSEDSLSSRLPIGRLVSAPVLMTIAGQICIHMLCLAVAVVLLTRQDFYVGFEADENTGQVGGGTELESHMNTVVLLLSNMQYMISGWTVLDNQPFRKRLYTNIPYTIFLSIFVTICILLIFFVSPLMWLATFLNLVVLPPYFCGVIFGIVAFNFAAVWVYQSTVIQMLANRNHRKSCHTHALSGVPLPRDNLCAIGVVV
eukprot:Lankesteria_metandrocarpae@DN5436_c0_g1_i2.p1